MCVCVCVCVCVCSVTLQLVLSCKWSPRPTMAIFFAVNGPPGPIMAATDDPPFPQVVPYYFSIL